MGVIRDRKNGTHDFVFNVCCWLSWYIHYVFVFYLESLEMTYAGTIAYRSNLGANISEGFLHSVVQAWDFLLANTTVSLRYHFMRGLSCMPHESANQIADTFLGDWVLMLDTDHVFAADAFYEMVSAFEGDDLDVLVGFTQKRAAPYHPVIYKTDFSATKDFETIFPDPIERQQLIPIDSSGAACLMVRRRVFDAIKKAGERPFDLRRKWNSFSLSLNGDSLLNPMSAGELPKDRWIDETFWEDTSFFWRVKMLGFKAYCAPWIKFHHLATVLVDETMIKKSVKKPL